MRAVAEAGINVALIKYWGKRDAAQNLPAVSSLALTLKSPGTKTSAEFMPSLSADQFELNGEPREDKGVLACLDEVRALSGLDLKARVVSRNTVLTASGLASSASGFAALGVAAWCAAGLPFEAESPDPRLVHLVRRGSGSAPRSLLGGLVELDRETGLVRQLQAPEDCPYRLVIAVLSHQKKAVSSREGMLRTLQTSPYFADFVASNESDLAAAKEAIKSSNFEQLGAAMERSTWRMHAAMIASDPPLRYMTSGSLRVIERLEALRAEGIPVFFTEDAGPQVKALCKTEHLSQVLDALRSLPELPDLQWAEPGPGACCRIEA